MKRDGWYDDDDDKDVGHTRFYTLLRLRPTCSTEEVQRSFRLLSRVFHPDKAALSSSPSPPSELLKAVETESSKVEPSSKGADDGTFVELQLCLEVLSDRVLRKGYDVGGVRAVRLLQRSQRSHPSHAGEANHLYDAVANAKTEEEAVVLLQDALEEFQQEEAHRRGQSSGDGVAYLDSSLACPMLDCEQESSALSVSLKKAISPQNTAMTSVSHSLLPTGVGQMSVGVGCELVAGAKPSKSHPPGSSTFAADARFTSNRRAKEKRGAFLLPAPDLAFRTRRQLSSGTVVAVDLFGNMLKKQTWSYSLSSFRNLKLRGSGRQEDKNGDVDESSPLHVQALWRCRIQAATGRVLSLVAQLRTSAREEAQYRLRLSLINPNSIKFAYKSSSYSDLEGGLAVSWTVGFWSIWNKLKVTWCQRIGAGRLTCRYGIKYDGRALLLLPATETGRRFDSVSPWTLLAYVYSNETSIRVPISLSSQSPSLPVGVAWMVTMLCAKWVEPQLHDLHADGPRNERDSQSDLPAQTRPRPMECLDDAPLSDVLQRAMPAAFREVARKKRDVEATDDGLVVLSVTVDGTLENELRDTVQFWVNASSLRIPTADILTKRMRKVPPSDESACPVWKEWFGMPRLVWRSKNTPSSGKTCKKERVCVNVRYSYCGWVYESVFSNDDDWIVIPSTGTRMDCTTRLGRRSQVH